MILPNYRTTPATLIMVMEILNKEIDTLAIPSMSYCINWSSDRHRTPNLRRTGVSSLHFELLLLKADDLFIVLFGFAIIVQGDKYADYCCCCGYDSGNYAGNRTS